VAGPVTWSAAFIDHHVAILNAVFAAIQLLLGLAIAWRPAVRLALAASVAWALAALALLPATRAPGALGDMIAGTTPGQPAWLAWIDAHAASALVRHGLLAAILLAAVLTAVALATYAPPRLARAAPAAALAVAALLWLAQGLGGILTGSATDPNTGPLLALLALSFRPAAATPAAKPSAATPELAQPLALPAPGPSPGRVHRHGLHVPGPAALAGRPGSASLAPRCAALCKIAMGLTMGYMLILML
jgi:hypothetical protein